MRVISRSFKRNQTRIQSKAQTEEGRNSNAWHVRPGGCSRQNSRSGE